MLFRVTTFWSKDPLVQNIRLSPIITLILRQHLSSQIRTSGNSDQLGWKGVYSYCWKGVWVSFTRIYWKLWCYLLHSEGLWIWKSYWPGWNKIPVLTFSDFVKYQIISRPGNWISKFQVFSRTCGNPIITDYYLPFLTSLRLLADATRRWDRLSRPVTSARESTLSSTVTVATTADRERRCLRYTQENNSILAPRLQTVYIAFENTNRLNYCQQFARYKVTSLEPKLWQITIKLTLYQGSNLAK